MLAVLALAAGCSNGVTLVVDVRTDLRPDLEFRSVELLVTRPDGSLARRTVVPAMRLDDFLTGQRVGELVDLPRGAYTLATRLLDTNGSVLVLRNTSLDVHDDLAVIVVITRDCRGLVCPASGDPSATECLGGRCVTPDCAAGDLATCPPPVCTASTDCPSGAACAPSVCTTGLCLAQPDDTLCGANEWCDPSGGCTPLPTDAGMPDAGARADGGVDAGSGGMDAGCSASGAACSTGHACERGQMQCVGGTPTCVGVGVLDSSTVCRPSAGPCDRAESCDGSSADCPSDGFFGSGRGCRASGGPCDPGENCDGSGPDCPADEIAPNGMNCGASWSELGCGPIDVDFCQSGTCVHDGSFDASGSPSCGAIGAMCGFSPQCCGSGGMFCIAGGSIYGSSRDCSQCCPVGNCCMDGNPAGPCT